MKGNDNMNVAAIYHRTSDQFSYALDTETLEINIQTGYDVKSVSIVCGDPFSGGILGGDWKWQGEEHTYHQVKKLENHLWWSIQIKPPYKRLKYYFIITFDSGEKLCYLEEGFMTQSELENSTHMLMMFTNPWLNASDVNVVPKWVNETVWYQIFPDRFAKGVAKQHVLPWQSGAVGVQDVYGGDLQGIIDKLDYIKDLGCNGIYLNPIFKAHAIHKYDTIDYVEVDPMFGDNETLKQLVKEAHKRDIKIMLDGVFNHTGLGFFAWQDVLNYGQESKYFDWYMIHQFPLSDQGAAKNKEFYTFAFTEKMPKLNTNNPEVIQYLLDVCTFWVEAFDIDAIRIDVANEISHTFNKQLRMKMKAMKDIYILGENWHDSMHWLRGDEFDSVMNYPLTIGLSDFWVNKNLTSDDLMKGLNRTYTRYMQQTNDVLFNLLDSHDTIRLINKVEYRLDDFYQQFILLFVMPGSPCIYYGTEVVLEGAHDPDCRRCMPWDAIGAGKYDDAIALMRKMIHLRREHQLMRSRDYQFIEHPNTRIIEVVKGGALHLIINATTTSIKAPNEANLMAYKVEDHQILPGGFSLYIK